MNKISKIYVDLRQMVAAIENAVSLVGMNDTNHGKRVGYIALQMANHLGFTDEEKSFVFELGLLHDCGVSSEYIHNNLTNQFDWEGSQLHCDTGYTLLKDFKPLSKLATPIRYHHTHWNRLKTLPLSDMDKRMANLIFLSDRVDVTAAAFLNSDILVHTDDIKDVIRIKTNDFFDPELVECFINVSSTEAFWLSLEDRHINRFAWDMANLGFERKLSMDELKHLSEIFAYIIDQKSAFTARHSFGVAKTARYLAEQVGLTDFETDKVEVAAYLHDIGKLHVPDAILEKPGKLTRFEQACMNQHSYETYEILRQVNGLEDIAEWAAYHHENCKGTGYPFHPPQAKLTIHARIIAVADVFQALIQDRPYRKGMQIDQVLNILTRMSDEEKLDRQIVETVLKNAATVYKIARHRQ